MLLSFSCQPFDLEAKPQPKPIQQLLSFPYTSFESQTLSHLCIHPPSIFSATSTNVLRDLAHTRLIAQGRFLEAIKLDRAIGAKGQQAEKRRTVLSGAVRLLPEVQRRILELEMDEGTVDDSVNVIDIGATPKEIRNGGDVDMMDDHEMSTQPLPIQPSLSQPKALPLSASHAFRTSSPSLAVHRASIAPTALASSSAPFTSQQQQSSPFSFQSNSSSSLNASKGHLAHSTATKPHSELNRSILSHAPTPMVPPPSSPSTSVVSTLTKPDNSLAHSSSSFDRPTNPFAKAASTASALSASSSSSSAFQSRASSLSASPFAQAAQRASMASRRLAASTNNDLGSSLRERIQMAPPPLIAPAGEQALRSSRRAMMMDQDDAEERQEESSEKQQYPDGSTTPKSPPSLERPLSSSHSDQQSRPSSYTPQGSQGKEDGMGMDMDDEMDDEALPGAFPGRATDDIPLNQQQQPTGEESRPRRRTGTATPAAAPAKATRSSHRRTNSQQQKPHSPPPSSRPTSRTKPTSTRSTSSNTALPTSKPKRVPGGFSAPAESDSEGEDANDEEEEARDVVPSPVKPAATRKRATRGSATTGSMAAARSVRTRSVSVLEDEEEEEEDGDEKPDQADQRKSRASTGRNLRSASTVSPEGKTRPPPSAAAGGGGRGPKKLSSAVDGDNKPAVRRSTRRTAGVRE